MIGELDYLAAALLLISRARRTLDDGERSGYTESLGVSGAGDRRSARFMSEIPKRPSAPSIRGDAAARKRSD
jgi:hypothetical protein